MKLYFFFFFLLADLNVPATEAVRKIMSWRKKRKMVYIKKKVGRNCRVFLRVSCLMRTILPERQPHLLPDLAPLWRYGVGSLPLSLATKDPSSSLTPGVVSFHSRLPAQAHVHWQVEVKRNAQEVSEVKESQWLYSRRSEAQTKSVRVEDEARMAAQKTPAGYGPLKSGGSTRATTHRNGAVPARQKILLEWGPGRTGLTLPDQEKTNTQTFLPWKGHP